MKSDFLLAITQLSAEKNLPKETVIGAVEAALVSAYKKDDFANQNIVVKIDSATGKVRVWIQRTVVESPSDPGHELSLEEAHQIKPEAQIGDTIDIEATPRNAGRIAAQTAKQVILQRLHEAEHSAIFEEYADKEGDIVTGLVRRIEPRQIFIDLGRTEAILPASEQVPGERYRMGQRLKVYLVEVARTNKGPQVVVSRSHPNMLRRLFELEVPEVYNGIVELKSVAREAGYRSKVAVTARQEGVDPVGCCVGLRGIRIQNIVNELNGEKIDVVMWSPDASVFITNALSPAQVVRVGLDGEQEAAIVIVPDRQLSLAIGKEGQNVRLAAKLTGWRIDIKSASEAEAEKLPQAQQVTAEMEEEAVAGEELPTEAPVVEPALVPEETAEETVEPLPAVDITVTPPSVPFEPEAITEKAELRFAEDILATPTAKPGSKSRRSKKKGTQQKETAEDGIKLKKLRRMSKAIEAEDDEEY